MSELKDYSILDIEAIDDERFKKEKAPGKWMPESRVYLKSEADKVIAELKAQKAQAEDDCAYWKTMAKKNADGNAVMAKQRAEAHKRERHQKYKLCLAVAMWCESEENRLDAIAPIFDTDKECWEYNSDYWYKWRNRWLKIAEKFKE